MIYGIDCAWCPNGPCSAEGKHRCEAESVLEASNVEAYETCYEGMKMDSFFSDNTFKFIFWDFVWIGCIHFFLADFTNPASRESGEGIGRLF